MVRREILKLITDKLKFLLIAYFSKHIRPDRFSLTNEQAKDNDFYEVHIYVPDASNERISKMSQNHRNSLTIKCEFMPSKNSARWGDILVGRMKRPGENFTEGHLSSEYLRYSRIDVDFYFGHWIFSETKCSIRMLFYLFILRFFRLIYLTILKEKFVRIVKRRYTYHKLRSPLKSKFEIYEALMNSDDFLKRGSFRKAELTQALFGKHYVSDFATHQKVSKSLDWILGACIDDGEIRRIGNQDDPLYEMMGKGIHYFTLTKEHLKNEEANRRILQQQTRIQGWMACLTILLVIGTFLSGIDKLDKLLEVWGSLRSQVELWFAALISKFV